jgi:phage tail protein X
MTKYVRYTTVEGDRWDTIAFKAYGDPLRITPLVEANPHIPKSPVLPSGLKMNVPLMDVQTVNSNLLPPWKR